MLLAVSVVIDQEVGGFESLLGVVGPLSYAYDTAVVVGVMLRAPLGTAECCE